MMAMPVPWVMAAPHPWTTRATMSTHRLGANPAPAAPMTMIKEPNT